jgi:P27 family predicted phage terminase small subunit
MGERAPKAPTWLPPEAQLIWRKEARIFYAAGILTHADLNTFALYCEACARYRKAAMLLYKAPSFMIRTPNVSLQHHPYLSILRAAYKDVLAIAAEFGGTPSARSRIDAHESAFPDSDTDKEMFGE